MECLNEIRKWKMTKEYNIEDLIKLSKEANEYTKTSKNFSNEIKKELKKELKKNKQLFNKNDYRDDVLEICYITLGEQFQITPKSISFNLQDVDINSEVYQNQRNQDL